VISAGDEHTVEDGALSCGDLGHPGIVYPGVTVDPKTEDANDQGADGLRFQRCIHGLW
jgi:hypothetical protein